MKSINRINYNYIEESISEQVLNELKGFEIFFEQFKKLSKNKREKLLSYLSKEHYIEYPKVKNPKYGNINRGFSEEEFNKLIESENNEKAKLCWKLQYKIGFRISEIPLLNINNINWEKKIWTIWTKKAQQWDEVVIDDEIEEIIKNWIDKNKDKIHAAKGYIFFSDNLTENRIVLSENWLRKQFRDTRKKAGLNKVYGKSNKNGNKNSEKYLYILTTHSLRHSAITKFYNNCQDIILTKKFARHKEIKSTLVYVHKNIEDIRNAIEKGKYDMYNRETKEIIKEAIEEYVKSGPPQEKTLATGNSEVEGPKEYSIFEYL